MGNTDAAWEKWGKIDPYYGVLTDDRYTVANIDKHRSDFFAQGANVVNQTLERYERNFGKLSRSNVLDYGCGVGRLTLAFADQFEAARGLDISPSMLAEAQTNLEAMGYSNAVFALADDSLTNAPGQYDFVNCYIVLQHIPVKRGMPILFRLIDKVKPGGGFLVHFSIRNESPIARFLYWARHNIVGANQLQNFVKRRPLGSPAMQLNAYPLQQIMSQLHEMGITELNVFSDRHGSALTFGLIGKKPKADTAAPE